MRVWLYEWVFLFRPTDRTEGDNRPVVDGRGKRVDCLRFTFFSAPLRRLSFCFRSNVVERSGYLGQLSGVKVETTNVKVMGIGTDGKIAGSV